MAKYTVRAGDTSGLRGDGGGVRGFAATATPPGHNVTTNAARHNTCQKLAGVGNILGGQREPASNKVKTGARPEMTGRPSIAANQADTSRDLERRLLAAPQPFTYDNTTPNMPTGRHDESTYGIPFNPAKPVNAKPQTYGSPVMSDKEMMAAVGYGANDTKNDNPIISGYYGRSNPRETGMPGTRSKKASRREQAAVRQSPIKLY